jgi:exosortase
MRSVSIGDVTAIIRKFLPEIILFGVLLWVYWPTFADLIGRWATDARYSHGFMVPAFAGYLVWSRNKASHKNVQPSDARPTTNRPSWWGLAFLLVGLGLRFAGTYIYLDWISGFSLLPCLAGCCLLLGGWRALRIAWPGIAFLIFMLPLPYRLEVALGYPLQRIATLASNYALQTMGFVAFAQGNVIRLGEVRIGVVEACSGLSMLMIFVALSTAIVLIVRRPWPEKFLILLSAVPIALISNITRVTVTGILHKTVGTELADLVFHDLAGYLMIVLALVLLWLELRLFSWVVVLKPKEDHSHVTSFLKRSRGVLAPK